MFKKDFADEFFKQAFAVGTILRPIFFSYRFYPARRSL